jgi:hypothetical protein
LLGGGESGTRGGCRPDRPGCRPDWAARNAARDGDRHSLLIAGSAIAVLTLMPTADHAGLSRAAANFVHRFCARNPRALLALPTRRTPQGMYRMLAHEADWVLADAQQLRFVNLDEYVGVPSSDRRSFSASCVGTFSSL